MHLAAELARPGSPSIIWNWLVPEVSAPSSNFRSVPERDVQACDPDGRFRREGGLGVTPAQRELPTLGAQTAATRAAIQPSSEAACR